MVSDAIPLYKTDNVAGTPIGIGITGGASALTHGDYPVTSEALAGSAAITSPAFPFPLGSQPSWALPPIFSSFFPTIATPAPTTTMMSAPFSFPFSSPLPPPLTRSSPFTVNSPATTLYPALLPTAAKAPCTNCAPIAVATQHIVMTPTVETRVEYISPCTVQAPPVQVFQAPPEIRYIQSPPEIRYVQSPPEVKYIEAPTPPPPEPVKIQDPELIAKVKELEEGWAMYQAKEIRWAALEETYLAKISAFEEEISILRAKLSAKAEQRSRTSVHETYKVKSFELASKLAVMDGTDDGLYNGLPIEVEGLGLYRDLVAKGYKAHITENSSIGGGQITSLTTSKETYKVKSFEMAEKLSKMDGTDDGLYNGLPIEVVGEGIYLDLKRAGRVAKPEEVSAARVSSTSSKETYKVSSFELAEKLSRMDGKDDGLYNGVPIEVTGQGLYIELVKARQSLGNL
eukprot:GGOE01061952.1.p1 GENE.GGOE01061952.1~~GGOE01061952.1.p1  ORF type:complete len:482 (+),score=67.67 GGOE01061952.1:78-1448(+)